MNNNNRDFMNRETIGNGEEAKQSAHSHYLTLRVNKVTETTQSCVWERERERDDGGTQDRTHQTPWTEVHNMERSQVLHQDPWLQKFISL